jgi:hypothetical protein
MGLGKDWVWKHRSPFKGSLCTNTDCQSRVVQRMKQETDDLLVLDITASGFILRISSSVIYFKSRNSHRLHLPVRSKCQTLGFAFKLRLCVLWLWVLLRAMSLRIRCGVTFACLDQNMERSYKGRPKSKTKVAQSQRGELS